MKIFIPEMSTGVNCFTCSSAACSHSLWTWWVSSFSLPSTCLVICVRIGLRFWITNKLMLSSKDYKNLELPFQFNTSNSLWNSRSTIRNYEYLFRIPKVYLEFQILYSNSQFGWWCHPFLVNSRLCVAIPSNIQRILI